MVEERGLAVPMPGTGPGSEGRAPPPWAAILRVRLQSQQYSVNISRCSRNRVRELALFLGVLVWGTQSCPGEPDRPPWGRQGEPEGFTVFGKEESDRCQAGTFLYAVLIRKQGSSLPPGALFLLPTLSFPPGPGGVVGT